MHVILLALFASIAVGLGIALATSERPHQYREEDRRNRRRTEEICERINQQNNQTKQ